VAVSLSPATRGESRGTASELFDFNRLGYTLDSDPMGDGLTLGVKLFRGYPLAAFNQWDPGGISRRRSVLPPVNLFSVASPGAVIGRADPIGSESATLNGSVSPNSVPTSAYFEYGLTVGYEGATPPERAGSGPNMVAYTRVIEAGAGEHVYPPQPTCSGFIG